MKEANKSLEEATSKKQTTAKKTAEKVVKIDVDLIAKRKAALADFVNLIAC